MGKSRKKNKKKKQKEASISSSSIISSFKDDLDNLINEEFYSRSRTPSYAVRIIENSIENNPITESYILQQNWISMTSKDRSTIPVRSARPFSSPSWIKGFFKPDQSVANKMHIYLSPTEVVNGKISQNNDRLGKPTRATLLKERMNSGGQISHSCRNIRMCTKSGNPTKSSESANSHTHSIQDADYAFLIGARYNRVHLLDCSSVSKPKANSIRKLLCDNQSNNSESSLLVQSVPSPSNSPQTTNKVTDVESNYPIEASKIEKHLIISTKSQNLKKCSQIRPITLTKSGPSSIKSSSTMTIKPSVLPIVVGEKYSVVEITGNLTQNSFPKHKWTRASLNLHIARQAKCLRNKRQDFMKNNRVQPSNLGFNQPQITSLSEYNSNEFNDKLKNLKTEVEIPTRSTQ